MSKQLSAIPRRIAVLGGSALLVGALGTGVAVAATGGPSTPPPASQSADVSTPGDTADQPGTESPAAEKAAEKTEAAGHDADGPGGHQDPAGNVDHEFDGNE